MSSTNNSGAVMSPEQEKLLYSIAQQVSETDSRVKNLHSVLYENGFNSRMKKIEAWIDKAPDNHRQYCPALPKVENLEESIKEKKGNRRRRTDVRLVIIAVVISFVASIPGWLRLIV